jgi:methionine sulfoxide reductase heme-binding subunit
MAHRQQGNAMQIVRQHWYRILAHLVGLAPVVFWLWQAVSGSLPITFPRTLMLQSGMHALWLLVASFACTPLVSLSGWRGWVQLRRPLGLYGFAYSVAHLFIYAWYDGNFDLALIWRDLGERRSMAVGLLALLLLVPLAITSTEGWQRRLARRWRTLHRLVYGAVVLAVLHYLWLERDIQTGAWLAFGLVGLLFVLRLPALRRRLAQRRRQRTSGREGGETRP